MTGNKAVDLSEAETELYDRQIRLWGLESQKRLRTSRILIAGMNGLGAEIAKNLILAGVKQVVMLDHRRVQDIDATSQFLAPVSSVGENRATASLNRACQLNTMVDVQADEGNIVDKPDSFFYNFEVVVVMEADSKELVRIDNACRLNNVKFFAADVWGMFGYSFADLQEHTFAEDVVKLKVVSKYNEKTKTEKIVTPVQRTLLFPPLQDVLAFDFKTEKFVKKMRRTGPAYVILRVLTKFRDSEGRDPHHTTRESDIKRLLEIRDEIAAGLVQDDAFIHVFAQISPIAAIVGGEVAQEVIKTVSQKEAPHLNLFLFDPETGGAFIEAIASN